MLRAAILLATVASALTLETVDVSTPLGQLTGARDDNSVISFLGVPYARPPVGDLRFRLPQSPASWNGTLNATAFGPVCYQEPLPFGIQKLLMKQSENCLTLDVYVDGGVIDSQKKMPVIIYIHGGAFVFGSSSQYPMNKFIEGRGIIAVVIQYRLGLLGFAQSPDDETIPGNLGLHDQVAALKWVKNYISNFGGDPDAITIAGESAGAISVAYHLVSPLSAGLFNRAILQSGNHATMKIVTKEKMNASMQAIIEKTNCDKSEQNAYECLRSMPVEKLVDAQASLKPMLSLNILSQLHSPSVDSRFFGGVDPTVRVQEHNFTSKIDSIIIGHNGNEGAFFLMFSAPLVFPFLGKPLRKNRYRFELQALAHTVNQDHREGFQKLIDMTFEDRFSMETGEMLNKMSKISGDAFFACPSRHLVNSLLEFNPETKVYYYHFTYRPEGKKLGAYITEALHGEEVEYVYGTILQKPSEVSYDVGQFANTIIDNWTDFVKTGNVADKKWIATSYANLEVQFNHITFAGPSNIQYRAGFPDNFCDRLESVRLL